MADPQNPIAKDPRAAALMSGDIDQVFSAFGFQPGFLNRKQFLVEHPEIIEYINVKSGEPPIQSNGEGYRGTSMQNGAYIQYFKEHIGEIQQFHGVSGNSEVVSPVSPEVPPSPPVPSLDQFTSNPSAETEVSEVTFVGHPESESDPSGAEFLEHTGETHSAEVPVQAEVSDTAPQPEIQEEITSTEPTFAETASSEPSSVTQKETTTEEPISSQLAEETLVEQPLHLEEETKQDVGIFDEAASSGARPEDLAADFDVDAQTEAAAPSVQTSSITSLYDLEDLDWWPIDDINLEVKADGRHGIMEIIHGSGLVKRSVLWTVSILEDGKFWLFTADETIPTSEKDQILTFEEFKELIENSY